MECYFDIFDIDEKNKNNSVGSVGYGGCLFRWVYQESGRTHERNDTY